MGGLRDLIVLHINPVSVSANGTSLTLPPPLSTSAVSGLKGRPVLCDPARRFGSVCKRQVIADMLSTASSPAHSRLREIEAVACEIAGSQKENPKGERCKEIVGSDSHHFPHVRQLKWRSRG